MMSSGPRVLTKDVSVENPLGSGVAQSDNHCKRAELRQKFAHHLTVRPVLVPDDIWRNGAQWHLPSPIKAEASELADRY